MTSAIVYGKGMTPRQADAGVDMANTHMVTESAIEKGDPQALSLYNTFLLNDIRSKGLITEDEVRDSLKKLQTTPGDSETNRMAIRQLRSAFE